MARDNIQIQTWNINFEYYLYWNGLNSKIKFCMQNAVEGTSGRRYLVGVYNFIAGTNTLRNMSSIPYFVIYEIFPNDACFVERFIYYVRENFRMFQILT